MVSAMYAQVDISRSVGVQTRGSDNPKEKIQDYHNQRLSGPIKLTIVFATHNGARKLHRMLESLTNSTLDQKFWKIVAVDNNSTDDTMNVLHSYMDKLPLQILFEPRPGKGNALNTAFPHIAGDLVIITDDDVLPSPDWMEQYLALADAHPEYDMFSGLIEPEWEKQPEPWLLSWVDLAPIYALNGAAPTGPIAARQIFGPNSAFRTRILPRTYTIENIDVGPDAKKRQYAMGGDTAFALHLEQKGHRALHSRSPSVRHIIPKTYVEKAWILSRAERYGKGSVHFYPHRYVSRPQICGVPVSLLLRLAASYIATSAMAVLPVSKMQWNTLWSYHMQKGAVEELFQRSKASPKRSDS